MTPAERVEAIAAERGRLLEIEHLLLRGLVVGDADALDLHRRVVEQRERLDGDDVFGPWKD